MFFFYRQTYLNLLLPKCHPTAEAQMDRTCPVTHNGSNHTVGAFFSCFKQVTPCPLAGYPFNFLSIFQDWGGESALS